MSVVCSSTGRSSVGSSAACLLGLLSPSFSRPLDPQSPKFNRSHGSNLARTVMPAQPLDLKAVRPLTQDLLSQIPLGSIVHCPVIQIPLRGHHRDWRVDPHPRSRIGGQLQNKDCRGNDHKGNGPCCNHTRQNQNRSQNGQLPPLIEEKEKLTLPG